MARRDPNPYAPPTRDDEGSPDSRDPRVLFEPASRWRRLGGALVDTVFNLVIYFVVQIALKGGTPSFQDYFSPKALENRGFADLIPTVISLTIAGLLIANRGQSVGKIVMMTRIVDPEGRQAGYVNGFLKRILPFSMIALIPTILMASGMSFSSVQPITFLTSLVALADALFIFSADRRCLHDRLADTYVAVVGSERAIREAQATRAVKKKRKKKRVESES